MSHRELDQATQESLGKVLRRAGLWCGALGLAVAVLGGVLGLVLGGQSAMWGAILGGGVGLIFSLITVALAMGGQNLNIIGLSGVMLGGWFGKMLLVAIGMYFLAQHDFYNRVVFFVALIIVVLGGATLDAMAVQRGRIPYVTPTRLREIQAEGEKGIAEARARANAEAELRGDEAATEAELRGDEK
ncbi:hypothetical protein JT358_06820 [Micrococcales bacterium 31B]|nr:hypothetical protein [Micrococcales bacterium 31B]